MKAASDAVYLMDKKGTIFESNVAACKMLGKPMEKIINSNIVNIDQNYPLDKFLIFWENLKFNNPVIFETTHTHVNGSQIPVEISSVKFKLEGQTMFYGIARDIRKRVDTLKKLKTSEERFKLAIEGAKDGLWDWNLITSEAYHSDRFAEMLGYEPEELDYTEKAWSDLLHPDDRKMAFKAVEDYLQQKVPEYKSTFRMRCKDGYYRWITGRGKALWNKEGKPYRFMGFNTDITSRRNSEKAFIKSQENYHRLFDTQKEGVLFFNENFDVIDANPAALDILGYSKINLIGKSLVHLNWQAVYSNGTPVKLSEFPAAKTLKNGEHCDKFVMGVQNPEKDSIVWVSISTAPIYDEDDITPSRGYTIFEDVTDKINAGKKIQQLNNSLIAAQEMVKLGYWSYNLKSKSARWSDQMYTILGLDKKNGIPNIGKNDNLIDNDYRMAFNEAVHLCLKGEQCKLTVKVIYPDKSIHYVLTQGFPRYNDHNELIEILGTSQDITELKKK